MSSGHNHAGSFGLNSQALDRILKNEQVQECLMEVGRELSHDFDVPYTAGYSEDGYTIYIDRHVPEAVKLQLDNQKKEINPYPFLTTHERTEKAIMMALGYGYTEAHKAATAMERRHVLSVLGPGWWGPYSKVMDKYIKADEHEKIQKLPTNLDMTPYYTPPVDKRLLAHLEEKMGNGSEEDRESD